MKHQKRAIAYLSLGLLHAAGLSSCLLVLIPIPPSFKPRVTTGEDFLEKTIIFRAPELGGITEILLRRPKPEEKEAIIVAGTGGTAFLEPGTLKVVKKVQLNDGKPPFTPMHIVDVDGDGDLEFFREPNAGTPAFLYDDHGQVLWKYSSPGRGFPEVTYGDLEGDGKVSFLLWSFPSDKIDLRDHKGDLLWSQVWNRSMNHLQILDTDDDERSEIFYIDGKAWYMRDRQGTLLRREVIEEASYINALQLIHYPDQKGRKCFCVGFNMKRSFSDPKQFYRILELDGHTLVKDIEPADWKQFYVPERSAELQGTSEAYHAKIQEFDHQGQLAGFSATRLDLSVYSSAGDLKYHEIIASSEGELAKGDGALAVVPPTSSNGEERLLVGYGPDLWEYNLKNP